ncbi:MAG: ABC transporter permease [Chloroflexi bacterium]|nr:ABC transporter permease [Chloroflexota bacterium]
MSAAAGGTGQLPSLLQLSWGRTVVELKQFWRNPSQVFFTFLLPVLFLVIFSSVFGNEEVEGPPGEPPLNFKNYFIPGIIAAGVMSTTFANLAVSVSMEQSVGMLKRLSGTPLPREAYFIGKMGMVVAVTSIQTAIMLGVGKAFFGVELPTDAFHWAVFGWVFVLGTVSCSALGIAYTRLIPNGDAASAVVQPPYLILQFISGVFFRYAEIPGWMQAVGAVFPLKWMAQGMRYAFTPDWLGQEEYGGWDLPQVAMMLGAWSVAGFVLAVVFFRWNRGSGS